MPLPRPDSLPTVKDAGALSGDVQVDDGERVYVSIGDVIAQKYKVDRILGVGGVGFVLAARHVDLDGHFALKFLKRRFLQDKTIVERFTREAKAACRIKSEYVARVYDVGFHNGAPFIVMEHLVGRDLADLLAERGAFSVGDVTEYAVQACSALAVAHASGIVHRDIKPENLFLVDHEGLPTIKLLDFGISKVSVPERTPTGDWPSEGEPLTGRLICGTPYYMSPEQIRSTATVDARSDVWSLGMVLYELLTGNTAFVADSIADVCASILEKEPKALADLRPDIPPALSDVIARCLRKDPDERFPSIAEMAVALLPFAPPRALAIAEGSAWIRRAAIHTLGAAAPASGDEARLSSGALKPGRSSSRNAPTSPSQRAPAAAAPALVAPALDVTRSSNKRRFVAAGAGAALVFAIAGVAFAMLHGSRDGKHDAMPAPSAESATGAPAAARAPTADPSEAPAHLAAASAAARPSSAPAPAQAQQAQQAQHAPPPVRHYVPPPPARPQPSVKSASSAPPAPDTAAAPAAAPTPSRPDLGY